jgi:hypothetical protein
MKTIPYTREIRLLKVTLKIINCIILVFLSISVFAVDVDFMENKDGTSTLIITDDCGAEHKLEIKSTDIGEGKELEFLRKLNEDGLYNKCLDN